MEIIELIDLVDKLVLMSSLIAAIITTIRLRIITKGGKVEKPYKVQSFSIGILVIGLFFLGLFYTLNELHYKVFVGEVKYGLFAYLGHALIVVAAIGISIANIMLYRCFKEIWSK